MIPARVLWAAPADEVVTDPAAATAPAVSGNDPGPKRESLALLPSWALEQKAAANRQLIVITRQRWAAGEEVAHMYQEPGGGVFGEVGVQHYSTITNQTSPHEACTGLDLLDKVIYHTRSWRPSQQTVERSTLAQARRRRRRRHAQGFAEQPASTGCLRIDAQASRPRMGDA
jgi:hypothetical protein